MEETYFDLAALCEQTELELEEIRVAAELRTSRR